MGVRTILRHARLLFVIATAIIVLLAGAGILLYRHGLEFTTGNSGHGVHFNISIGEHDPRVFALVIAAAGFI